ncbi:hypothetical protein HDV05_003264 [Chytridiales sp. JEL 0842]|nr:hypothetical protein HDV05_003264 [Chytridiales sp. JEL 0842]
MTPQQPDESMIKRLLTSAMKTRREGGDLYPSVNQAEVKEAAETCLNAMSKGDRPTLRAEQNLREALQPRYAQFFSHINQLPGGLKFLVNLRADLLKVLQREHAHHHLKALNEFLKGQLQNWFGMGFLDLERITWSSPGAILEKVALLKDIEWDVQRVLNDPAPDFSEPQLCNTAIFYSISSTQRGLSGVDLGNFLIKRVVKEIQKRYPQVTTFCTLSPIPGFRKWLDTQFNQCINQTTQDELLLKSETDVLRRFADGKGGKDAVLVLKELLEDPGWHTKPSVVAVLKPILVRLCSRYLLLEKKRSFALDPVANFHIRNGACVHRLNWMGDISEKGLAQSFGLMVNYVYLLPLIESNNQTYLLDGKITLIEPLSSSTRWAAEEEQSGRFGFARMGVVTANEGGLSKL